MRRLLISVLCLFVAALLSINTNAQKRVVTGKVVDSTGSPIPNVTVRLKAGRGGVSTAENGTFHLSATPSDVLILSAIGYDAQELRVGDGGDLTIVLHRRGQALNEVVVTALGIRRTKNSLPYATQQIGGDQITKTMNTNFIDNMSGKVAGLQITSSNTMGGSNNVILRGMKSLTQNNQALFVVDGVPYDNTNQSTTQSAQGYYDLGNAASDINPNDIESVSVLKGAAASALYGSRGSNGVILITTKRGSRLNKGLGVSVNFGINVGTPDNSTLPQYQTMYGEGYGSQASTTPGNPNPFFYYQPIFNSNGQSVQIVQTDIDQMTGPAYDPNLLVYQWDAFSPGNPNYGKATPWKPAAHYRPTDYFVTPVSTSTSVFVDGGSDKSTFKMGYTRSNDKGYLPNSNQSKDLLNMGITYNPVPQLTVGGEFNYSDVNAIGRYGYGYYGGNGTQINPMTDFRQWWETGIDLPEQRADFFRTQTNATWNWLGGYLTNAPGNIVKPAYHDNPYWVRYKNFESDGRNRYFGNAFVNYKIGTLINLLGRVSKDDWNEIVETRYDVGSAGTPSYSKTLSSYDETNYDFLANLDKNIGEDFNLKALLGGNIRQDNLSSTYAITNGGLVVPGFFALANSVNTPSAPSESFYRKEVDGIFAGATLSWKDMVTLDATLRRDKSSTLPKANAAYYYPAVSANWVFSKLLPATPWLSYGKLRVNYAAVGGDAGYYALQNTYVSTSPIDGQTIFNSPTTNNNPNLVPEMNHTYEIGAEMQFLQNRLGFDVTYYHAQQLHEIMPIIVSGASGFSQFYVNGGSVQNAGVELTINITPIKTHTFSWDMNINWAKNNSTVLSLYNNQASFVIAKYQNAVQLVAEKGKPYGVIRGSDYTYLNGQIKDSLGYPVRATNALSDIGNISPQWLGGINNTFRYKDWSLSFLIDVKKGGDIYSLDMDYGASAGLTPHTAGYNKKGTPVRAPLSQNGGYLFPGVNVDGKPNTTYVDASDINQGNFPFSSDNQEVARSYVYDAGYVKLREAAITYSLPAKVISNLHFVKGLDFSLTGRNLWIIHKNLPYADPEQGVPSSGSYGANASMGYQSGSYPVFRTFGFNLKARF
ncbi:MAG TPA: SusC/RagA family TonB-linked outer membrane protein [Puia sp.]|nr:SusC/RagA family TonB-linked outer membrane protein [Puia sp.]